MKNVFQLDAHERMTVEECLAISGREGPALQDVIVLAYDKDGKLVVRSSAMDRKDAAWLLLAAMDYVRGVP